MKRLTAALLTCGIVAGVMLPTVLWIADATRPGYSLCHHGASQLGLGCVRRVLQSGRGATWGPALLAAAGIGLVRGANADSRQPCGTDRARGILASPKLCREGINGDIQAFAEHKIISSKIIAVAAGQELVAL